MQIEDHLHGECHVRILWMDKCTPAGDDFEGEVHQCWMAEVSVGGTGINDEFELVILVVLAMMVMLAMMMMMLAASAG